MGKRMRNTAAREARKAERFAAGKTRGRQHKSRDETATADKPEQRATRKPKQVLQKALLSTEPSENCVIAKVLWVFTDKKYAFLMTADGKRIYLRLWISWRDLDRKIMRNEQLVCRVSENEHGLFCTEVMECDGPSHEKLWLHLLDLVRAGLRTVHCTSIVAPAT